MSRYFTRLAERTGLHASAAPVSTPAPGADIVEQEVQVEAEPAAAMISRSAAPQASAAPATPPGTPFVPSNRPAPNDAAAATSAPRAEAPALDRTLAGETSLIEPARQRESAPQREPVLSSPSSMSAPAVAPSEEVAEFTARVAGTELPRSEPPLARADRIVSRAAGKLAAAESSPAGPTHDAPQALSSRAESPPFPFALQAEKFSQSPAAERAVPRERTIASAEPKTPAASWRALTPSQPAARADDITVRIGAIKLEIHPPPAPLQYVEPRREAAAEPPRFQLRRHYLRW